MLSSLKTRKIVEKLALVFAAFFLALCVYLLTDHRLERLLSGRSFRSDNIGEAHELTNDVRRRFSDDLQWMNIADEAKVFDGDLVFTGKKSSVNITLKDGSAVKLSEDSLVAIHLRDGDAVLELEKGTILGTLGDRQKIVLEVNGHVTRVTGGHANAKVTLSIPENKTEAPEMTLSDNSVKVESLGDDQDDKHAENVLPPPVPGQAAAKPEVKPSIRPEIAIELTEPAPNVSLKIGKLFRPTDTRSPASPTNNAVGLPVRLGWQDVYHAGNYEVQLSNAADFSSSQTQTLASNSLTETTPRLLPGKYFWRVRRKDPSATKAAWSKTRQFEVAEQGDGLPGAPQLVQPGTGLAFIYNPAPNSFMPLQWAAQGSNKKYLIQVSRTADFTASQLLVNQAVDATTYYVPSLGAGTYYWRVCAINEAGEMTVFSDPWTFKVELDRPVPQNNDSDYEIEGQESSIRPNSVWQRLWSAFVADAYGDTTEKSSRPALESGARRDQLPNRDRTFGRSQDRPKSLRRQN